MSTHGDALLQPLVLTEDEAELVLTALELLIERDGYEDIRQAALDRRAQLYDKIKGAPRQEVEEAPLSLNERFAVWKESQ